MAPKPGASANLGASPCILLSEGPAALRLAAPVPPGEAVWVSLELPAGVDLVSAAAAGRPLPFAPLAASPGAERLLRSETLGLAPGHEALRVEIQLRGPAGEARLTAELNALAAFNARFGLDWRPDPAPETYGGWRLP